MRLHEAPSGSMRIPARAYADGSVALAGRARMATLDVAAVSEFMAELLREYARKQTYQVICLIASVMRKQTYQVVHLKASVMSPNACCRAASPHETKVYHGPNLWQAHPFIYHGPNLWQAHPFMTMARRLCAAATLLRAGSPLWQPPCYGNIAAR